MSANRPVIIYGASGFSGRLVAEYLREYNVPFIAAGRNRAKIAEVMKNVGGFRLTDFTMEDVKFLQVSDKAGLISYKLTEKGVTHGKEFTAIVYVSSIWAERGGKWVCEFSQETAARVPPAAPVAPPAPTSN